MYSIKRTIFFISIMFILLLLMSCATTGGIKTSSKPRYERGIWHRVEEGQTLWRIAKTYGVSIETLKKVNDIGDVLHIRPGTWLFIPGAKKQLYVQGNLSNEPEKVNNFSIVLPAAGNIVRTFGRYRNSFNYGIDIKVRKSESIVASQSGVVVFSKVVRGYGDTIIIDHGNNFFSLYARNIESLVHEGQKVQKSSVIARVRTSSGTGGDTYVVHYELFYRGKTVNPLYYVK